MSALSTFATISIPPGGVVPINQEGRNFHVVFAAADILVKLPGGEFGIYQQGSGSDNLPDGETFRRLEVRNPTLGDLLVTIYIGGPLYRDSRASLIEPRTVAAGWNQTQIAATTNVDFTGVPAGLRIRRKAILITNLDQLLRIEVRDGADNLVATVFAEQTYTLPISEFVRVRNPNGAAVAANLAEIWWSL